MSRSIPTFCKQAALNKSCADKLQFERISSAKRNSLKCNSVRTRKSAINQKSKQRKSKESTRKSKLSINHWWCNWTKKKRSWNILIGNLKKRRHKSRISTQCTTWLMTNWQRVGPMSNKYCKTTEEFRMKTLSWRPKWKSFAEATCKTQKTMCWRNRPVLNTKDRSWDVRWKILNLYTARIWKKQFSSMPR